MSIRNICIIAFNSGPELGVATFMKGLLKNLVPKLSEHGIDVDILTNESFFEKVDVGNYIGIDVVLPLGGINNGWFEKFYQLLVLPLRSRKKKYDLILYLSNPLIGFFISNAVIVLHDLGEFAIENKYGYMRTLLRKIFYIKRSYNKAVKVIVISDYVKLQVQKYLKPKSIDKVSVVYNGVSFGLINNETILEFPDSINKNNKYFLTVGRIDPLSKNLYESVELFSELKKVYPEYKYYIVGGINKSTEKEAFKFLSYIERIPDVVYLGYVNERELPFLYSNALCVIFLSKNEGFGYPLLEAYHFGCPVITHSENLVSREIGGGYNMLVDSSDIKSFSDFIPALKNYLINVNKADLVAHAQLYNWNCASNKYYSILNDCGMVLNRTN